MKIFLFNSDEYQDYLSDLINYHFINSEHEIYTNYIPSFLFDDYENKNKLYGNGFTVYGKIESKLKEKINVISNEYLIDTFLDSEIDQVLFTSIRRSYLQKNIFETYLKKFLSNKLDKILAIDGEDDNLIIKPLASKIKYFKRELLEENSKIAFPISFSFPEFYTNNKNLNIENKTSILSQMDPRFQNSYIFDEESYYTQYAKSIFATTTKKNGWDCLRHYEIIASGCLPFFPNIENKPKTIMKEYPTQLQIEVNQIFENIILGHKNINSAVEYSKKTNFKYTNKALKKMSDFNLLENNFRKLQKYIFEYETWFNKSGKSNIYEKLIT
tara:strand:+ start:2659 stop:3642 length:984 start_codon:yes stop_codon:yes gene_type:complete